VEVPTWAKLLQLAPGQRSIKYWLMVPPVSVEPVQERLTCEFETAAAVRFEGAVRVGAAVVAEETFEYGPRLLSASPARTR